MNKSSVIIPFRISVIFTTALSIDLSSDLSTKFYPEDKLLIVSARNLAPVPYRTEERNPDLFFFYLLPYLMDFPPTYFTFLCFASSVYVTHACGTD